jgi:hypothetical protein
MKLSTIFLQGVIVLVGVGVLVFLLWEPHLEGRNVNATWFQIYFKDPFLAYVYLGSIPFFVGLERAFKFLSLVRQGTTFSEAALRVLRTIRKCALITAGLIVGAAIWIRIAAMWSADDPAGFIMLCIIATLVSLMSASWATILEQILQKKDK